MSDFHGTPAQLKDKDGTPTGEWGAWVNDLPHVSDIRSFKAESVGMTVTVRTKTGEEREETIAEVLYVKLPQPGEDDDCSMLVRFGGAQPTVSSSRSELAQALLTEMKGLRKDIRQLRSDLREGRTAAATPATAPSNDDDLPW